MTILEEQEGAESRLVPALARGNAILDLIATSGERLTISDLSRRLSLPKSTVHGLCTTLVQLDLLVKREDNSFRIGPHVMRWSNSFMSNSDLVSEFTEICDSIGSLSGYTITLTTLHDSEVVYIAARNSNKPLGVTFSIGMRLPAVFTATGKAILSTMKEDDVRAILANRWPIPLTHNSVPHLAALLDELQITRAQGYSVDNGQVRDGMWCFGAPVRGADNKAIAGVAVSLLQREAHESTTKFVTDSVRRVASLLSQRLGADGA